MGTSLCDVTVTLKHQWKIVNISFLNSDTFCYKKICMFDTFTKKSTRNYTAAYTNPYQFMIYYNTKRKPEKSMFKRAQLVIIFLLSLISSRFKIAAWMCSRTPLYMYCLHQYFHSKPPISGHYRPTSETPLRWCFGCGPIVVHLYVFTVSTFVDYSAGSNSHMSHRKWVRSTQRITVDFCWKWLHKSLYFIHLHVAKA